MNKTIERIVIFINRHWQEITLGIMGITLIMLLFSITQSVTIASTKITDWGLSFGKKGELPRADVSAKELAKNDAYYIGDTEKKVIYLTFDAGYENGCTEKILNVLKEQQVPAAFFLVEHYFKTEPSLVKRMYDEGHIVANHTATHSDMSKILTKEALEAELSPVEERYKEITGDDMKKFYRPPQGKYSGENLAFAKELGYKTIFWSLAYVDWNNDNQPGEEYAINKLSERIHNGAVILLHSTSKTNAMILERIIKTWREQGYEFAPLSDLVLKK